MKTIFCIDTVKYNQIVEHEEAVIYEGDRYPRLKTIETFWKLKKSFWRILKMTLRGDACFIQDERPLNEYDENGKGLHCIVYKNDGSIWYDFYEKKFDPV